MTTPSDPEAETPTARPRPPMHRVELPGGTLRYRDTGRGAPVVLVPGLFVDATLWDDVVARLEPSLRCLVPELPLGSHRVPMPPDADLSPPGVARLLADFLAALDLREVTLVGNDTGGAICQLVAAHHPQRIGRLVLTPCDAYDRFLPPMFRYLQVAARVPGAVGALLRSLRLRPLRRLPITYGWLAKRPIDPAVVDGWLEPALTDPAIRRDVVALLRGIHPRHTLDAAERLRRFDRPTLIAFAPEDRVFPFDHGRRLARDIPGARLEHIDDSFAFAPVDQPERVATLVREFVGQTPDPAAVAR